MGFVEKNLTYGINFPSCLRLKLQMSPGAGQARVFFLVGQVEWSCAMELERSIEDKVQSLLHTAS